MPTALLTVYVIKVLSVCHSNMWKMASQLLLLFFNYGRSWTSFLDLKPLVFHYLWTVSLHHLLISHCVGNLSLIDFLKSLYIGEIISVQSELQFSPQFVVCLFDLVCGVFYFYIVKFTSHFLSHFWILGPDCKSLIYAEVMKEFSNNFFFSYTGFLF